MSTTSSKKNAGGMDAGLAAQAEHRLDNSTLPSALSDLRPLIWLKDLAIDWTAIAGTFAAWKWIDSWWALPLALFFIGSRQHALGLLGHDALHYLAFRNRRLNDMMGSMFVVWPLFVVLDHGYRPWHFAHHRWLGTDKDPEASYYAAVRSYHGAVSWRKVSLVFVTDMLGFGVRDLLLFIWTIAPNRGSAALVGPVIFWAVMLAAGAYFHVMWVPLLWIASLVTGFWAVFRVRAWTEHADVPLAWRFGRSNVHRFSAGWLARYLFFPHNTHCHYEHHQWPQVPYYNLPAARQHRNSRPVTHLPRLFPWKHNPSCTAAKPEEPSL